MAVSIVLRLSSSCPPSTVLLFRAFGSKGFSLTLDAAAHRSRPVRRRAAAEVFPRRRNFFAAAAAAAAVRPRLVRFCSSSAPPDVEEGDGPAGHRWPEWESFVEMLTGKGHFGGGAAAAEDDGDDRAAPGAAASAVTPGTADFNRVKNACLAFARERFDLLRSLPVDDIQAIVELGCPTIHRKPINSGKRLRAFLLLNETDVCGACSLRGSCDRANQTLHNEQGARTVDVIRILLYYAVDPDLLLRFDASGRRRLEASVRRLLSLLTDLSDTPVDPSPMDPAPKSNPKSTPKSKLRSKSTVSQNVEMKRGDWLCSKCNFLNFSRNLKCMECGSDGPKMVDFGEVEMKKGDWACPGCQFVNFARNRECRRCQERRPPRDLNPGEWECPSCDYLNYRRNKVCLKCKHERPGEEPAEYSGEHAWRRPAVLR